MNNSPCTFCVHSGAEDMHAYVWDRYYGICLAKYQHTDVVNSVAFNPRDSEMLVTTSDDYTIKVNALLSRCVIERFSIGFFRSICFSCSFSFQ